MTAKHFLRHLATAYIHFHPIDDHKKFAERLDAYEKKRLKGEILTRLASIEARFGIEMGRNSSEELSRLKYRIESLKRKLESG